MCRPEENAVPSAGFEGRLAVLLWLGPLGPDVLRGGGDPTRGVAVVVGDRPDAIGHRLGARLVPFQDLRLQSFETGRLRSSRRTEDSEQNTRPSRDRVWASSVWLTLADSLGAVVRSK